MAAGKEKLAKTVETELLRQNRAFGVPRVAATRGPDVADNHLAGAAVAAGAVRFLAATLL